MCHELMEVEFGKNVNFIVGENGSGKSAVLTSIILGLGGAIGIAGRGTKKASVIKHGKPQADVVIELYNEGAPHILHVVHATFTAHRFGPNPV
jgi:chromosome segregation ATPase